MKYLFSVILCSLNTDNRTLTYYLYTRARHTHKHYNNNNKLIKFVSIVGLCFCVCIFRDRIIMTLYGHIMTRLQSLKVLDRVCKGVLFGRNRCKRYYLHYLSAVFNAVNTVNVCQCWDRQTLLLVTLTFGTYVSACCLCSSYNFFFFFNYYDHQNCLSFHFILFLLLYWHCFGEKQTEMLCDL